MQIDRGEKYPLFKPTYFVGILDFDYFESESYLSRHIIVDGESHSISNITNDQIRHAKELFIDDHDDVEIHLEIHKELINNSLSIYIFDIFSEYVASECIVTIINEISKYFTSHLCFEIFHDFQSFGSNTIKFNYPFTQPNFIINNNRDHILEQVKLHCHINGINELILLPTDFTISHTEHETSLHRTFVEISKWLSVAYIADISNLRPSNIFSFKINGYQIISGETRDINSPSIAINFLLKIFAFIYEQGEASAKIGLVRNILTLHANNEGLMQINQNCWDAIQSNYSIYLKDNVEQYIAVKNKLTDFVVDSFAKSNNIVDSFVESFRKNTISIITFFISIVLINGLKDNGMQKLITFDSLIVVLIVALVSLICLTMSYRDIKLKIRNNSTSFNNLCMPNYNCLISDEEISRTISQPLSTNKDNTEKQLRLYTWCWSIIIIIMILTFIIGVYIKNRLNTSGGKIENEVNLPIVLICKKQ